MSLTGYWNFEGGTITNLGSDSRLVFDTPSDMSTSTAQAYDGEYSLYADNWVEISEVYTGSDNTLTLDMYKYISSYGAYKIFTPIRDNGGELSVLATRYVNNTTPKLYVTINDSSGTEYVYGYLVDFDYIGWHRYTWCCSSTSQQIYADGNLIYSANAPVTTSKIRRLDIGNSGRRTYIDEVKIYDEVFVPPPPPLGTKYLYKDSSNSVFGTDSGVFGQVIADWTLLSNADKIQAFKDYGSGVPNYSSIINNFKIMVLSDDDSQLSATMSAIPTPKVLTPNKLLDLGGITTITDIIITATQNGTGVVKVAVTKDLINYFVYNGTNFVQINDIAEDGNTVAQINSATTQWNDFLSGASGVAFMFYISQQNGTDIASVDKVEITGDIAGVLKSAQEYVDFEYAYDTDTNLKVKFITSGDYKINYPE